MALIASDAFPSQISLIAAPLAVSVLCVSTMQIKGSRKVLIELNCPKRQRVASADGAEKTAFERNE